jgi:hypothetical protein
MEVAALSPSLPEGTKAQEEIEKFNEVKDQVKKFIDVTP